eukprot:TRINITY_DN7646_c0_g1_i2.p1 TRINITY_DN7646_c0_g1~~TRINITY_DN7646_c0_g1_i2.p1  ORF type:complete len:759 (+),score=190.58 TRINITY_DN7646_c0_g1_i2:67-2343(+)
MAAKPPPSKEAVAIVWDMGKHMQGIAEIDGGQTMEECRAAIAEFMLKKIQYSHQDEVGLVVGGTEGTHNQLAVQYPGEYQHITCVLPIGKPSPDDVKKLKTVKCEGGTMDMIDCLVVAGDLLNSRVKKLRFRKRVFLFTSAGDEVDRKDDLEAVVNSFKMNEISLIVVGVGFTYNPPDDDLEADDWDDLTEKQQNEKVLHHMVATIGHDSIITPLDTALRRLTDLSARSVLQRTMTRGCWEFGEDLKIPVFAYMKTAKFRVPSLRRVSKKTEEGDENTKVNIERRYFRSDDPDIEVPEPDRVKAYQYGCTVVPFNEVDTQVLKFDGGIKSLRTLAFIPKKSIRRHHLMHGSAVLATPPNDPDADAAFVPLVQALYEMDMAVILRVVKVNYKEPTICVAWPHITNGKKCLMMNELPYCEDLRKFDFKNYADEPLTADQLKAAGNLINTMDLSTAGVDEEGEQCEALRPRDVYNPVVQYFQQAVRVRLLKGDAGLPPLDEKIAKSCCLFASEGNDLAKFFQAAHPHIENLKTLMSVKLLDKDQPGDVHGSKKYWFADGRGPVGGEPPAKKRRLDDTPSSATTGNSYWATNDNKSTAEKTLDMDKYMEKKVVNAITTMTPVTDFNAMIRRVDGDFVGQAIKEMQVIITKLVQDSIGSQLYNKAKECVQALRDACVREDEPGAFNTFLAGLKKTCAVGPKQKFWTLIQTIGVSLITAEEVPGAGVSRAEAEQFLKAAEVEEDLVIQPSVESEPNDDLFGALD